MPGADSFALTQQIIGSLDTSAKLDLLRKSNNRELTRNIDILTSLDSIKESAASSTKVLGL